MNLAEILSDIGSEGVFQVMILLALAAPKMPLQWSMTMMSYAAYEPEWCCVPASVTVVGSRCDGVYQGVDLNVTNVTNLTSLMYKADPGSCDLNETRCQRKVYLAEDGASTAVTEWDLVCDKKWVVPALSSIQMGGVMIGALVSGSLSDVFGRRRVNYVSLLGLTVFNIITGFSNSWIMFAVMRFLIGFAIGAYLVVHVPYILEFVSPRWRVIPASLPFAGIGASLLPLAAWLLPDWRWMHFICAMFCAPFLLGYFFLPESMRWLTVKGKVDEAMKVVDRIAAINKKEYDANKCYKKIQKIAHKETQLQKKGKKYSYLDVYRGWKMARLTLTLQFVWFTTSLVGYGIILGISDLAGDVYLNMFLVEAVEIPFVVATFFFSNCIGRRYTALAYFVLATISAVLAFVFHMVPSVPGRETAITVLCIGCRSFVGGAAAVFIVVSTEVYPTVIRTLGYGAANTAAKVGGVVAPFLINMDTIPTVSYAVMASTCLLCVAAVLSLKETKNIIMEDTMEKAGSKSSIVSSLSVSVDPSKPRRSSSQARIIIDIDTDLIHHRSYSEFDDDSDDDDDNVQLSKEGDGTEQSTLLRHRHPMYDPTLSSAERQESLNSTKSDSNKSDSIKSNSKKSDSKNSDSKKSDSNSESVEIGRIKVHVSTDTINRAYVGDETDSNPGLVDGQSGTVGGEGRGRRLVTGSDAGERVGGSVGGGSGKVPDKDGKFVFEY